MQPSPGSVVFAFRLAWILRMTQATLPTSVTLEHCEVSFERTEHLCSDLDADLLADLCVTTRTAGDTAMFQRGYLLGSYQDDNGVSATTPKVAKKPGITAFMSASNLASLAKRLHQFVAGEFGLGEGGFASYRVNVKYSARISITFETRISTDFLDPSRFEAADVRSLERLSGLELDLDIEYAPPATPEPIESFLEASEVLGDSGAKALSHVPDAPSLEPLEPGNEAEVFSMLDNTILHPVYDPVAKYAALSRMIVSCFKRKCSVLILGDHPGLLAQSLLADGCDVTGVDPSNATTTLPGMHGRGRYVIFSGRADVIGGKYQCFDDHGNDLDTGQGFDVVVCLEVFLVAGSILQIYTHIPTKYLTSIGTSIYTWNSSLICKAVDSRNPATQRFSISRRSTFCISPSRWASISSHSSSNSV
ncbi:unnamed protein product [Penicillium viridicatum]